MSRGRDLCPEVAGDLLVRSRANFERGLDRIRKLFLELEKTGASGGIVLTILVVDGKIEHAPKFTLRDVEV